jgi:uncharacterized repeat protein (TIGR03803 family)
MGPDGAISTLHSFDGSDGSRPLQLIRARDGDFYGMTEEGGPIGTASGGVVYKITADGTFTQLHIFFIENGDGSGPSGALVQGTDGDFYGTTQAGGSWLDNPYPYGTVFKITPSGQETQRSSRQRRFE